MILRTILGISFAFIMPIIGASCVFLFKNVNKKVNTIFYGLSAGIMLAATIWSLIIPSINNSNLGEFNFLPAVIGILIGAFFIVLLDFIVKKVNKTKKGLHKSFKIFLAMTIHNIPEGLAVGFAFGVGLNSNSIALVSSALTLAIGIGLQNFPEGLATTLPLKSSLNSTKKAFLYGVFSCFVELVFSIIGVFLAYYLSFIMSYILAFSAGAMLYVIIEELLPEANLNGYNKLGTWSFIVGFLIMMILDVVLG